MSVWVADALLRVAGIASWPVQKRDVGCAVGCEGVKCEPDASSGHTGALSDVACMIACLGLHGRAGLQGGKPAPLKLNLRTKAAPLDHA